MYQITNIEQFKIERELNASNVHEVSLIRYIKTDFVFDDEKLFKIN